MKVALYYPWVYLKSGVEKTILELTKRSRHEWVVFTSHYAAADTYPELKEINIIELSRIPVRRSFISVSFAALKILTQKINLLDKFDAFLIFSEGLGDFIVFRNNKIPVICYCWTPLKVIYDPFSRYSYLKNNKIKIPLFFLSAQFFKFFEKIAWRYYKHVFCCSQEIKKRIVSARITSLEKIEVLHPGVDAEKIEPAWTYDNYFFLPSRIKWWKNIELSIAAFKRFQEIANNKNDFRLIIAGQVDKGSTWYYKKLCESCCDNNNIEILPDPDEYKFEILYKNCYAVLNTTLNEDWGLVILEAMAYGKPVIAVNQGGPKESIRNGENGLLTSPTPSDFAEAMKNLSENKELTLKMGKNAREESFRYKWSNFVQRLDDYIDNLTRLTKY